MSQHFLLSRAARSLPVTKILRMSEAQAYTWFKRARWPETDGKPYCPACGVLDCYELTRRRFKCSGCRKEFSVTSGTVFAFRKLSFRQILGAIALSTNAVKGKSALLLSRELGVTYKTAFVLLMKLREAVAAERKKLLLDGTIEIDGMYIGGKVKPKNKAAERKDRRLAENQSGKRRTVMALRQRNGRTVTAVTLSENVEAVRALVQEYVAAGAHLRADEHPAYNMLEIIHPMIRVNHRMAYANDDGENTNQVESYFSRVRRSERGVHHRMASTYLDWYAADLAYREDMRRHSNEWLTWDVLKRGLGYPMSRWLKGYWQGNHPDPDQFLWKPETG